MLVSRKDTPQSRPDFIKLFAHIAQDVSIPMCLFLLKFCSNVSCEPS